MSGPNECKCMGCVVDISILRAENERLRTNPSGEPRS
jgi:hypothetical protein